MKSIVLTHQYPKDDDLYKSAFIHQRVIEYKNNNLDVEVWVLNNKILEKESYEFEDVIVNVGNSNAFNEYLNEDNDISSILVHFLLKSTIDALNCLERKNIPILVWVHLFEVTSWRRRLFEFNNIKFLKYIKGNISQLSRFKKFKESTDLKVSYIFVSQWIKEAAEKDLNTTFNNAFIIHNYISENLYKYNEKDLEKRKKILSIRTFQSKKYANDITAHVIKTLSKYPEFKEMEFAIYGDGKYFNSIARKLSKYSNVKMYKTFLNQKEIASLHNDYGVFLCPTRQDSQGVSMCEAMASGLVTVSSNNTAIPEFVEDMKTGLLGRNHKELAENIMFLYKNPYEYSKISKMGAKYIRKQCGIESTINEEIKLIEKHKQ
ncbi:glycosyltransferase family 4 protein [Metabacillus idriensis]|uniref:glycosyltransferase family 4 protein n=1 Tax=Metabacillus idriensis TaxID=324768 RepID=UPI00203E1ED7|nr:glycosyltransferase family 4 protein [Metabacillus idriensis]MCM3597509.1 glycosyltransferase family 4 protein [Metabacillus idriensis]